MHDKSEIMSIFDLLVPVRSSGNFILIIIQNSIDIYIYSFHHNKKKSMR